MGKSWYVGNGNLKWNGGKYLRKVPPLQLRWDSIFDFSCSNTTIGNIESKKSNNGIVGYHFYFFIIAFSLSFLVPLSHTHTQKGNAARMEVV